AIWPALWKPPVDRDQRVAELLDPLEMRGVGRDQLQAMREGEGGYHRIGQADGTADALQLASDAARQLGGGPIEGNHFFRSDGCREVLVMSEKMSVSRSDLFKGRGLAKSPHADGSRRRQRSRPSDRHPHACSPRPDRAGYRRGTSAWQVAELQLSE